MHIESWIIGIISSLVMPSILQGIYKYSITLQSPNSTKKKDGL